MRDSDSHDPLNSVNEDQHVISKSLKPFGWNSVWKIYTSYCFVIMSLVKASTVKAEINLRKYIHFRLSFIHFSVDVRKIQ